jgi:hypothetical protein
VAFEPGLAIVAVPSERPFTVDEIVEWTGGELDRATVETELEKMRSQGAAAEDFEHRWSLTP